MQEREEENWKQMVVRLNRESNAMEIQYKAGFEISRKYGDEVYYWEGVLTLETLLQNKYFIH